MDWSTIAALLRLDVGVELGRASNRLQALRGIAHDIDEALAWAKQSVAVAIADEIRGRASLSVEEQATQRESTDKVKSALRALHEKRASLEEMIRIVSAEKSRTDSPEQAHTEPPAVEFRAEIDAPPGYSVSRASGAVLRVSGPPGGIDTLAVFGTPHFFEGHSGTIAMWGMADPEDHGRAHQAGVQFENGTIRIQGEERPAVAYLQRYMRIRHYVTMVAAIPVSGGVAVLRRRMESRDSVPWDRLGACPLLGSLRFGR